MDARIALVAGLVVLFALGRWASEAWRRRLAADVAPVPRVPADVLGGGGASRTWVVFTTPYCATCGPVTERLQAADRGAAVVTVDATRRPDLADAFRIRRAPTALLAEADGSVVHRLVGPEAVAAWADAVLSR